MWTFQIQLYIAFYITELKLNLYFLVMTSSIVHHLFITENSPFPTKILRSEIIPPARINIPRPFFLLATHSIGCIKFSFFRRLYLDILQKYHVICQHFPTFLRYVHQVIMIYTPLVILYNFQSNDDIFSQLIAIQILNSTIARIFSYFSISSKISTSFFQQYLRI